MEKKSFGNCTDCPLKDQTMVTTETNCDYGSDVDLLILAEAPANEEIKQNKPLVGKAGQIFRNVFNNLKLNEIPHCISNVVMCANIDDQGRTDNPPKGAFECCKPNWNKVIELCNPKMILIMGSTPMKMLGIAKDGISKLRGNVYKYNDYDVFLTYHPSYIGRTGGLNGENGKMFQNDLKEVRDLMVGKESTNTPVVDIDNSGIHSIKIPNEYYTDEYMLFDVQYIKSYDEVLYIFKDADGHKQYHSEKANDTYYYYTNPGCMDNCPTVENYKNVNLEMGRTYDKEENRSYFECTLRPETKHTIDFRYNEKVDPKYKVNVQYMDIEVFAKGEKSFPDMDKADRPINAISFKTKGDLLTYVHLLSTKYMDTALIKDVENTKIEVFDSERKLLKSYFKHTIDDEIDIVTGWNLVGFDIPYIFNRCRRLSINMSEMSPVKKSSRGQSMGHESVYGLAFVDMLDVYKKFSDSVREMYKLDFICKLELGEGKVAYEGTLDTIYMEDINKFIDYSRVDTVRLEELDTKLKHLDLLDEMIGICSTTYSSSRTTVGFLDPMIIAYAKKQGLVCRDPLYSKKVKFPGAYVKDPVPGMHKYVIDLDFTSLYPSVILSCNLDTNTYICKISEMDAFAYLYARDSLPDMIELTKNPSKKDKTDCTMKKEDFLSFMEETQAIVTITGCVFCGHDYKLSFLTEVISFIWDSRTEYKEIRSTYDFNSDGYNVNHNRQWAYKILMNSIYGVLGNRFFRMYNLDMARTITATSQEIIRFAQVHTSSYLEREDTSLNPDFMSLSDTVLPKILYGDTDSLYIAMGEHLTEKGLW